MFLTEPSTISTVVSAMKTQFTSMTSDMLSGIGEIVPVVLPIVGAVAVVFLGIRLFKRLSKG